MATILDAIVRDKQDEVARRRMSTPRAGLEAGARARAGRRDIEAALRPRPGGVRLIAEVKKASPSRGVLSSTFDPVGLAGVYATHGAAAISVLTDEKYFQGRLELLAEIRAAVAVPLLRKDFVIDEYQLWESAAAGADAVLLIVAILEPPALRDLLQAARGMGLGALVEAHTAAEAEVALEAGATLLGINNRDLRTFETRIETTLELLPVIARWARTPPDRPAGGPVPPGAEGPSRPGPIVVSESGFSTAAEVRRVVAAGAQAVLVGEGLVRAPDVAARVRELALLD
jgi:indole-3-glycerol phosphate synthase